MRVLRFYFLLVAIVGTAFLFKWVFDITHVVISPYITGAIIATEVFIDWVTTVIALNANLGIKEGNSIHRYLMNKFGYLGDFIFTVTFVALILAFLWPGAPASAQLALCCAYPIVYINNFWIFRNRARDKKRAEYYLQIAQG